MTGARVFLLTTFLLGRLRPGPGTWGSAFTVALTLGLVFGGASGATVNASLLIVAILFSIVCVSLGPFAERHFGRKDPPEVVADETAGQALALLALPWQPAEAVASNLLIALAAFAAFRLLDITKPPPIRQVQALPGGWGILADDLAAGVLAGLVAQAIARLLIIPA